MRLIRIFTYLPFWCLYPLSNTLAWLTDTIIRYRRKVVVDNLRHAFPELEEEEITALRRQFYRHFTDVWLETLKGLSITGEEYSRRVKLQNPEMLLQFIQQGRPVMVLASHRSNWEWLTPSHSYMLPAPVDAVYKKIASPFFERLMLQIRSRFGARMVEKDELLRDCIQRNHIPRLLAIMFDQSPHKPQNHSWYLFMNRPTPFYNASEKLATKLNMPVVFADIDRVARGQYAVVFRLITAEPKTMPKGAITEAYVRIIEEGIRRKPAEYLWTHKRWKHQPASQEQESAPMPLPGDPT